LTATLAPGSSAKEHEVSLLGGDRCVAIGNGANDVAMLAEAALGIAASGPRVLPRRFSQPPTSSPDRSPRRSTCSSSRARSQPACVSEPGSFLSEIRAMKLA